MPSGCGSVHHTLPYYFVAGKMMHLEPHSSKEGWSIVALACLMGIFFGKYCYGINH